MGLENTKECISVLKRYTRAVIHMRQQFQNSQFGLIFGAGIGSHFGFPRWHELLERMADHPDVLGKDICKQTRNDVSLAQQLFQKYRLNMHAKHNGEPASMLDMRIRAGWRNIVHSKLYQGTPARIGELIKKDRYLLSFLPIIKKSPLTVTYNFDDTLERMLAERRSDDEVNTKGYTTYWSGNVQLRAKAGGVIYHPNGFLPHELRDRPSDQLVFLEDSFADQLIASMAGHYASLATHLSQTTCLLIGLSLDDPTLKHLLRQSATSFPGHFHYHIRFVRDGEVGIEQQRVESEASFNVYNLISLHLDDKEIKALAQLISAKDDDFLAFAQEHVEFVSFKYYVVGCVGAGKSTVVSHFRSLLTQDEWTERRAAGMEKAPDMLSKKEIEKIDEWVADQVAKKNVNLLLSSSKGIHLVDRAPLDAFAFTPQTQWKNKAERLHSKVSPGSAKEKGRKLASGHVIFLLGDPRIMAERAVSLHKNTNEKKLQNQQAMLCEVYGKLAPAGAVTWIDTRGKGAAQVAQEVAAVIFKNEYAEADLHRTLLDIKEKGHEHEEQTNPLLSWATILDGGKNI